MRPHPTPTLRPEDSYLQSVWPQSVHPVAERFGVELRLPNISPQPYTAMAWQGYQFARADGRGHVYNDLVLRAFFQKDQDIGRIDVLTKIAQRAGLNTQRISRPRYATAATARLTSRRWCERGVCTQCPTSALGSDSFRVCRRPLRWSASLREAVEIS